MAILIDTQIQEKIRSLTPFALELGFYIEEYAGPKGRLALETPNYGGDYMYHLFLRY